VFGWSPYSLPGFGAYWILGAGGEVFRPFTFDASMSNEEVRRSRNYWVEPASEPGRVRLNRSPA
jgi:hypothetical protein